MGTYRRIDVRIWNDPKYRALDAAEKLVFMHAVTSAQANISGVYGWSADRAARETGLSADVVRRAITSPRMDALILFDAEEEVVFVRAMYGIQTSGPKTDVAARAAVELVSPTSPCVHAFATRYPHLGIKPERAKNTPSTCHERHTDRLSESQKPTPDSLFQNPPAEQEQEQEQYQEQEREGLSPPGALSPEGLAELWADACPELPQPRTPLATGVRKALATALRRERGRDWPATFARIAAAPFLRGDVAGADGTTFRADLLWAVRPEKLAALEAGRYDPRGRSAPPNRRAVALAGAAAEASRLLDEAAGDAP